MYNLYFVEPPYDSFNYFYKRSQPGVGNLIINKIQVLECLNLNVHANAKRIIGDISS